MAGENENQEIILNEENENHIELKEALGNIQYIRDIMESSKDYFLSGYSGIVWGIILIVAPILTAWLIKNAPNNNLSRIWIVWLVLGIICAINETFFFFKGAKDVGKNIFSDDFYKVMLFEFALVITGLIFTFVFISEKLPEYIPGAWLLTTASFVICTIFIFKVIWVGGVLLYICAAVAFLRPETGLFCVGVAGFITLSWGIIFLSIKKR